ncbi:NACHT domain-containing protein [Allokutzneria albata]|uniref:ATP-binding protein n=1 Tax=Allokutzneria albata TaxID=211114 RepID=A0A1G9YBT1_ALLAB|nr:hypothetical protein [Allokutzneria albata]SDN06542.1 hypothetical protein SAMN04489726_4726 [Allokutzneria albata]
MSAALPDIDFARIRPYGQPASRSNAFEELASVLIQQSIVEWPGGVRFYRFGNPDGGREGKGVLPDGGVWAWQAKYLFEFDSSAAGQVNESVLRVLDLEPNLNRYFVALPIDLPAGDTAKKISAHTRWTRKVEEWEELARAKDLEVEFVFIGAHQLVTALTEPRHSGRAGYWFGADVLTPDSQGRQLDEIIAKAGRRYSPRLHVEVDAVHALEAVGRAKAYVEEWQRVLADLREARAWTWRSPSDVADFFNDALPHCGVTLDKADAALELMISAARSTDKLPLIDEPLKAAAQAVMKVEVLLHEHARSKGGYYEGDAGTLYSEVREALRALRRAEYVAGTEATRAAREKVLLLTGRAGAGKTHLFCDVATQRVAEGRPTVLLLGQDFDGRSLLPQIGELTRLGSSVDDVFAVLDAAAEAAGCFGLFMIDALNESERPERWRDDARALLATAAQYPRIAVALSCRSEFVAAVVGDDSVARIEHVGFAESTDIAVRRFTQEYGLEPPTFPVLNPEFSNPLFLKLTCESLATLGATRFPFGAAGLTTVCNAFLEAVNKRLAEPGRSDYDERSNPVGRVIRELTFLGGGAFDREDVQRITDEALPGRSWSQSLMRGLIAEGVLTELSDGRIAFGYQRLGDVARAAVIAEASQDDVRAWVQALADEVWRERGVLGALAVIVSERYEVELIDLAKDDEGTVSHDYIDSFLESLLLRSPKSISPRTVEIVRRLFEHRYRRDEVWDRLIRIACIPDHPLNANWLHTHLNSYEVADRDTAWSAWLVGTVSGDSETAVSRLIEWAWPSNLQDRSPTVPDDVAVLATKVLGSFLTTSDRRVRDRATKAIVSVAERAPAAFARALGRFHDTNDPYVIERLAAAACGVVLRTDDVKAVQQIADSLTGLVADGWPQHLVTRDFIRRTFSKARTLDWPGPDGLPPYNGQWITPTRAFEEIEALTGPPNYEYSSIWHSLTGLGDFGRYVVQPALDDIVSEDSKALLHETERAVFGRVLDLGWTPERFSMFDQPRSGRRDGVVERVGKKYQWIGFYEALGRITDRYLIKRSWADKEPQPYSYAEQLIWRDMDPTVLARKPVAGPSRRELPWFSPVGAQFQQSVADDCPDNMDGVPDPLDLIAVFDPDGTPWLALQSSPNWKQPLPPEVKALRVPRLDVWMQLHAYLVPVGEAGKLRRWAKGKDWFGRWMPESAEPHNILLGTHPDDPEWSAADGRAEWWDTRASGPQPTELEQCAAWYGGTGTSRDASAEEETRGYVPTRRLFDVLGLSRGVDFAWNDGSGLAVHDPSVVLGGPSTLVMRRDLTERLVDAGLTLFWTVLAGNELHRSDHMPRDNDYRWVSASASYILEGTRVEQIGATAARYRPGPRKERELRWVTKGTEG